MTLADGEMDEGISTKAAGNAYEILQVKIECFAVSSEEAGDACIYRVIVLLLTGFFRGSGAIIGVEEGVKVVVHTSDPAMGKVEAETDGVDGHRQEDLLVVR